MINYQFVQTNRVGYRDDSMITSRSGEPWTQSGLPCTVQKEPFSPDFSQIQKSWWSGRWRRSVLLPHGPGSSSGWSDGSWSGNKMRLNDSREIFFKEIKMLKMFFWNSLKNVRIILSHNLLTGLIGRWTVCTALFSPDFIDNYCLRKMIYSRFNSIINTFWSLKPFRTVFTLLNGCVVFWQFLTKKILSRFWTQKGAFVAIKFFEFFFNGRFIGRIFTVQCLYQKMDQ